MATPPPKKEKCGRETWRVGDFVRCRRFIDAAYETIEGQIIKAHHFNKVIVKLYPDADKEVIVDLADCEHVYLHNGYKCAMMLWGMRQFEDAFIIRKTLAHG